MDKSTLFMKDHLVRRIEETLGWGKGTTWGNRDFEELSERIFDTTNKKLSVTTLKRIWGRAERVANPSMTTLDILSQFIGHENWRGFVLAQKQEPAKKRDSKKINPNKIWIPFIVLVLIGTFFGFFWKTNSDNENNTKDRSSYRPEDFVFTSRPVSTGIPNSVVFDYDASAADEHSKIEIQQDWDETKRMAIDKTDSIATSIYYRPGFFKSKLVIDSTIVKEEDVLIPTDGWLGIIERESLPIYLDRSEVLKEDRIAITPEVVASHNLDPRTDQVVVGLYQVRDFGELYTDNFEMAVNLRNDFTQGVSGACQGAQIFILYDGGAVGLTLAKKGCASDLTLMTFEGFVDGKKNDLSGFGVDFSEYVELKCISQNNELEIFVDNKPIYKMIVPEPALKIKGITLHFEGAGSVKNVSFKKHERVVFASEF